MFGPKQMFRLFGVTFWRFSIGAIIMAGGTAIDQLRYVSQDMRSLDLPECGAKRVDQ